MEILILIGIVAIIISSLNGFSCNHEWESTSKINWSGYIEPRHKCIKCGKEENCSFEDSSSFHSYCSKCGRYMD